MSVLLSMPSLAERLDLDLSAVLGGVERGAIPQPLLVDGLVRWSADDISRWVSDRCPPCDKPHHRIMHAVRRAWLDESDSRFDVAVSRLSSALDHASPDVLRAVQVYL
jgi:predicted DNA-binding transcriptional regulator AlpA